jgi:hypothetical protein
MYMKTIKRLGKWMVFLGILALAICGITYVLLPKIPDFYEEDQWDVVFFGTSETYCTFDPAVFDEYGLKTYNRGRSQQPMEYTYYYVKDALDVSDIDVVVLEIFGMSYGADDSLHVDAGVRDSSLNDMRYSLVKVEAIRDCVPLDEQVSYLFPLDKYHSNWEQLSKDFTTRTYKEESERGFWGWLASEECGYLSGEELNSEIRGDVWSENMKYLEMIYDLCQEKGSRLVLVRAPLPCTEEIVQWTNTVGDWADAHDVEMINCMKLTDAIGLDFATDSLDGGSHLNAYGADKVSKYLAEYLCSE